MNKFLQICTLIFWQLFASALAFAASPIFERTNPNLWLVDENTGQMSSYRYSPNVGVWIDDFETQIAPTFSLQNNEQALINNLPASSQIMSSQLAPISLAGLGLTDQIVGSHTGVLPLHVTPASGSYSETIMVEMAVNVSLANEGPVSLEWSISGAVSDNGSATLIPNGELRDGRLYARFYLVKDGNYTISIRLLSTAQNEITTQALSYTIANTDPAGERRDTDKDGLPDLVELAIGLDPLTGDWKTDSNNNGWSDFDEWLRLDSLEQDGLPLDSDNDGWSDFDEALRGTNPNDLVQALVTQSDTNPAPTVGTANYQQKLRLFQDIPAATRLYEVEYLVDASANEIQADTYWQAFSTYSPGNGAIFHSDELLTAEETTWADAGFSEIPTRRTNQMLGSLIQTDEFNELRLPASHSQIIDIRGFNAQTVGDEETGFVEEMRHWHLLHWMNTQADLSPLSFEAGTDWESADEWKAAFISYLGSNLVVTKSLQINSESTTNASMLLSVLAKEYELAGGLDQPLFNQKHGMSSQIFENLKFGLARRENGRTLDDVFTDLLSLTGTGGSFEASASYVQNALENMPWRNDSLTYLPQIFTANKSEMHTLQHIGRLLLFKDGLSNLAIDSTLSETDTDSDSDSISNHDEILTSVFSQATYPWTDDTDIDALKDNLDPCPLDELNQCQLLTPLLSLSGPGSFNIMLDRSESGYIVATVELNRPFEQDVSVDYELAVLDGDTAVAGENFEAMTGILSIPAGESSATIIVNLLSQSSTNSSHFHLVLSDPKNATLGQSKYPISVDVEPNDNPNLQNLQISSSSLDPAFSTNNQVYDIDVISSVDSLVVTPTAEDANATIEVNNVEVTTGSTSQEIALTAGSRTNISIKVTADNGLLSRTYTLRVDRPTPASDDANLSNLSLSTGSLSPTFDTEVLSYTASVGFTTTSLTVTPVATNGDASITVDGSSTSSGNASDAIVLSEGENTIEIVLLAEDGETTKTYTVVVTRETAGLFIQEAYIKASSPDESDFFGSGNFDSDYVGNGIALSGNTLAIGVIGDDSDSSWDDENNDSNNVGAVYVFVRDNDNNWSQEAYLKATIRGSGDMFGSSVALDGDTLVVGAVGEDSGFSGSPSNNGANNSGAVYVFTRDNSNWSQQAYLKASNIDAYDEFGVSVTISSDTLAIGALEDSNARSINGDQTNNSRALSGAVYVFVRDNESWSQQAYIKASNANIQDRFGISISLNANTLAVGANQKNASSTGSGSAYIYTRSNVTWSEQAIITASNAEGGDLFGKAVSVYKDTLIVGAPGESSASTTIDTGTDDNTAGSSGAAYVFTRSGLNWTQQAYLKASNAETGDGFGTSVSISANALVVGAYSEDSASTGVNSDQTDNSASISGAAYVFIRDGEDWAQHAYLKASNNEAADLFGVNVAISGETISVGSRQEDSSANGINGNEGDNSSSNSGAVYMIRMPADSNSMLHNNAKLNELRLSNGTLSPVFDSETLTYSAAVGFSTTAVTVLPTLADIDATLMVNGVNLDSGNTSNSIDLVEGENRISIAVLAEDASTSQTYVITVTRMSASEFAQQVYLKSSNPAVVDSFANSVAISGDTLVIGAPGEDSDSNGVNGDQLDNSAGASGAAYVFIRGTHGIWQQQAYLKASNSGTGDSFGHNVDISGDTIAVGAYREGNFYSGVNPTSENDSSFSVNSGAVYIFTRDGNNDWSQQAYIKSNDPDVDDYFGYDIALSGDTLAVGMYNDDSAGENAGTVFIYTRESDSWSFDETVTASNIEAGDSFGFDLDLYGDTLAVTSRLEDSNATGVNSADDDNNDMSGSGAVYVFVQGAENWTQQAYIKASNTAGADLFGSNVSISGDTLAVGAFSEDSNATGINQDESDNSASSSGAVYVFSRDNNTWSQEAYIKASNTDAGDYFGAKLAISGDTLAVSATRERSSATSIDGDQTNNLSNQAGAVYIYKRDVNNEWSQSAYIKASNTDLEDQFGNGLALDASTLIVGAAGEDSDTAGVNGNQIDGSSKLSNSGATYIYYTPE